MFHMLSLGALFPPLCETQRGDSYSRKHMKNKFADSWNNPDAAWFM